MPRIILDTPYRRRKFPIAERVYTWTEKRLLRNKRRESSRILVGGCTCTTQRFSGRRAKRKEACVESKCSRSQLRIEYAGSHGNDAESVGIFRTRGCQEFVSYNVARRRCIAIGPISLISLAGTSVAVTSGLVYAEIDKQRRRQLVFLDTMIVRALSRRCSMFERLGQICRAQNSYFSLDANENRDGKDDWRTELLETMKVFPDFITSQEEESIFQEVEPYMKRLRYEYSHWDDAIHGYRETERAKWNAENSKIIDRVRAKAFPPGTPQLGLVHVLDLAADGKIKPHVDSVRFCGDVIAGISLLSDCVMRMTLVGNEQNCKEDFLLPRRSLYIMSGAARQKYNHEVLGKEESTFRGEKVEKGRRISVICRSEPEPRKDDT